MRKIILLICILFVGTNVFALDCSVFKLDNGQTVIIQQVKNNPIVIIDTWIKTGSINETDKNNGVAHFLEHLFFKGTKKYPTGEFDKILESKGAITNAGTSKDFTHYYITIPSSQFDLAMDLHADMLMNPLLPRKELEKERKVVLEEISKDATNPSNIVFENLNSMIYKTHPYKRKVIGTKDVIENITREEILEFYNKYYTPSNMITIIIGDVDVNAALAQTKKAFAGNDRPRQKQVKYKKEKQLTSQKTNLEYIQTQSGYLIMGYQTVDVMHKDTYALDILATILGDGKSSMLNQAVKEQKQLAFSIGAGNSSYKDDGRFFIQANFTPENLDKLERAIFEQVKFVQKNGVSQEDLTKAKNVIERDTHYARESVSNIASELGYTYVLTDGLKYYDEYLTSIKKVTLDEVKRVASKYLQEDKCAISVVLPETSKSQVQAQPTVQYSAKLLKEEGTIKKYELDNKATMLVNSNKLNDIIAIDIIAKGGNFLEKTPSTALLTAGVMLKGTKKYSAVEFAQTLEENGIKIVPSASADVFTINVLTTKSELDKTMQILDEVINNATFDDYEIEKVRTTKLNAIKKSRDMAITVAVDEYKTLIYEGSPYSNSNKVIEKTLPKVEKEDILNYYKSVFNPKNVVISVNGDVEDKYLVDNFSQIFKPSTDKAFDYKDFKSSIPHLNAPKVVVKQMPKLETAWVVLGWQVAGLQSQKEFATLQVIDSLLGSGMSSRLFRNLRVQEGLAYQLGSSYGANMLGGAFITYIGTNPATKELAKNKMFEEVFKLKSEFVSDKELKEAKEKLIGNYILSQETNLDKASTLGWFEASGRGFEFKDKYIDLINGVTSSDIIEVANKYFTRNNVTSIVEPK